MPLRQPNNMKPIATILCLALIVGANIGITNSDDLPPSFPAKARYMVLSNVVSTQMGIQSSQVKYVLKHESSYSQEAIGDHGLANGVAQFHKETFDGYEKLYFKANGVHLSYEKAQDQIILMAWMWKTYPNTKNLWTTYRHMNGGKIEKH